MYKAGDTVQYKIWVRDQENRRFILPPAGNYSMKVFEPDEQAGFSAGQYKA